MGEFWRKFNAIENVASKPSTGGKTSVQKHEVLVYWFSLHHLHDLHKNVQNTQTANNKRIEYKFMLICFTNQINKMKYETIFYINRKSFLLFLKHQKSVI